MSEYKLFPFTYPKKGLAGVVLYIEGLNAYLNKSGETSPSCYREEAGYSGYQHYRWPTKEQAVKFYNLWLKADSLQRQLVVDLAVIEQAMQKCSERYGCHNHDCIFNGTEYNEDCFGFNCQVYTSTPIDVEKHCMNYMK